MLSQVLDGDNHQTISFDGVKQTKRRSPDSDLSNLLEESDWAELRKRPQQLQLPIQLKQKARAFL